MRRGKAAMWMATLLGICAAVAIVELLATGEIGDMEGRLLTAPFLVCGALILAAPGIRLREAGDPAAALGAVTMAVAPVVGALMLGACATVQFEGDSGPFADPALISIYAGAALSYCSLQAFAISHRDVPGRVVRPLGMAAALALASFATVATLDGDAGKGPALAGTVLGAATLTGPMLRASEPGGITGSGVARVLTKAAAAVIWVAALITLEAILSEREFGPAGERLAGTLAVWIAATLLVIPALAMIRPRPETELRWFGAAVTIGFTVVAGGLAIGAIWFSDDGGGLAKAAVICGLYAGAGSQGCLMLRNVGERTQAGSFLRSTALVAALMVATIAAGAITSDYHDPGTFVFLAVVAVVYVFATISAFVLRLGEP